jgi:ribosomal protein L11 methylase PrmA
MLALAQIKPGEVVYDLGCGDGRFVIAAARQYGVHAVGFDIDPQRVREARKNVHRQNLDHLVTIERADMFTLDLSGADVVTLYLLPELNVRLMPQLARLKPGSRVVSREFDMQGAAPHRVIHYTPAGSSRREHTIYLWTTPWEGE